MKNRKILLLASVLIAISGIFSGCENENDKDKKNTPKKSTEISTSIPDTAAPAPTEAPTEHETTKPRGNTIKYGAEYKGNWIESDGIYASRYLDTFTMNEDGSSCFVQEPLMASPDTIKFSDSYYENGVYYLSGGIHQKGRTGGYDEDVTGTVTVNDDGSIEFSADIFDSHLIIP